MVAGGRHLDQPARAVRARRIWFGDGALQLLYEEIGSGGGVGGRAHGGAGRGDGGFGHLYGGIAQAARAAAAGVAQARAPAPPPPSALRELPP